MLSVHELVIRVWACRIWSYVVVISKGSSIDARDGLWLGIKNEVQDDRRKDKC